MVTQYHLKVDPRGAQRHDVYIQYFTFSLLPDITSTNAEQGWAIKEYISFQSKYTSQVL